MTLKYDIRHLLSVVTPSKQRECSHIGCHQNGSAVEEKQRDVTPAADPATLSSIACGPYLACCPSDPTSTHHRSPWAPASIARCVLPPASWLQALVHHGAVRTPQGGPPRAQRLAPHDVHGARACPIKQRSPSTEDLNSSVASLVLHAFPSLFSSTL